MQYIKERASYFYERYKHIHVTSIAQLICKDWKKTHPNKPKKVNKARKVKDGSVSNLVKNLVQIDTSAWLEGILNQVKMDETEKVIAQAKFEEYTRFGQRPTFSGALQYVERGLEFSRRTECRAQMISDTLDQNAKKRVQEWERRTYKTTFEKLTDTSWAQNNWLDTFKTETC